MPSIGNAISPQKVKWFQQGRFYEAPLVISNGQKIKDIVTCLKIELISVSAAYLAHRTVSEGNQHHRYSSRYLIQVELNVLFV